MTKPLASRRPIIRLALSRAEVALSISVSVSSVDQMVAEGALPSPRKWHSRKLWLVSEIEAYLNELPSEGGVHREISSFAEWKEFSSEPIQRESMKGSGGYPIITDPDSPIKKYYDQLGFDPVTMGRKDLRRLTDAAQERWKASIPGTPLGKREREALQQLANYEVGIVINPSLIKNCGADTHDRLEARGFLKVQHDRDRIIGYVLTEAGLKASRADRPL